MQTIYWMEPLHQAQQMAPILAWERWAACWQKHSPFIIQEKKATRIELKLGTYSNTIVQAGKNTVIMPNVAPTGTISLVTFTNTNYTGVLTANPFIGAITISDAKRQVFTK